jgi:hypothetical protein
MKDPFAVRSIALTTAHSDPRAIGNHVATKDAVIGGGIVLHWVDLYKSTEVRHRRFANSTH